MVRTIMMDEELTKEIGIWAYKFVAKYSRSYPRAFVGVEIQDIKQMLWEPALEAKTRYEKLPDEKKSHSMRAYIKRACMNFLSSHRTRELFNVERTKAAAAKGISEREVVQVKRNITDQKPNPNRSASMIDRFSFKTVQNALHWYAQYLTTDWHLARNVREQQSFDDVMCIAVDIGNIFDRHFNDNEKLLLLQVGIDGFEPTLRRMRTPRVGNNKRYLGALVSKMDEHLKVAGYMRIRPSLEQAA